VSKQAILYISHFTNRKQWRAYTKLKSECANIADAYFVLNLSSESVPTDSRNVFPITPAQRAALGHPPLVASKGGDQAVLAFRRINSEYDYYWIVEYDVAFSGNWSELFNAFADSTSDLLCSNLHRRETNPGWHWWNSLEWPNDLKPERIRGFLPFARLSAQALDAILLAYQNGINGHYELTWPTVLHHYGFVIEDIGGDGPFVRPNNINRWYTSTPTNEHLSPGTLVFRPTRLRPGRKSNKLWHPVKYNLLDYVRGKKTYTRIATYVPWMS